LRSRIFRQPLKQISRLAIVSELQKARSLDGDIKCVDYGAEKI